ncbi:MAG TPA: hypothetical protein DEA71_17620 [Nitrospira sp.]|nr:hypothetical protein [Nitrospira sp.]
MGPCPCPSFVRLAGRELLAILQGFGLQQVSQRGSHVKLAREVTGTRQVLTVPRLKMALRSQGSRARGSTRRGRNGRH